MRAEIHFCGGEADRKFDVWGLVFLRIHTKLVLNFICLYKIIFGHNLAIREPKSGGPIFFFFCFLCMDTQVSDKGVMTLL